MTMDFDFQHSINGGIGDIIDGECVRTVKLSPKDTFIGYKLLSDDHVKKTLLRKIDDKTVEIRIIFDEEYIDSIRYKLMADVIVDRPCGCCCENETIEVGDIDGACPDDIGYGDRFIWEDQAIEIRRVFKKSLGKVPTIMTFYRYDKEK